MVVQKKVTTIPATLTRFTATPINQQKNRRVAGYARVSTDHDDQFTSYAAQVDYYTNYIKGRDDWEFVEVYTDEGITGTSTKHREGFKQMIADALDGKIDLIVTKSVSRFARNTVDSLTTIRQLKEAGVEVYFEKENIWTFDGKGELLLTIMSSTKHREGFKQMIADALDGKIDLIVTKSVSRFARNTVDSLTTIRQLKEAGVEVYFEKENIWTFDGKGELLLTIMSSLAQEESRSISENCTWGQRKRFADGKVSVPFQRFLGYDRGPDGNLVVNREQAVIVKRIYSLFLQGMTYHGIADTLTKDGIPTPGGKKKWSISTVKSILSNEKYKGDALLQKSYTVDFLTKKTKVNEGEIPQYYVEDNHEAIIDPEVFEMVQREMAKRGKGKKYHSGVHAFSTKIKCGECGSWYGSKVWHSNSKYRKTIWQCNHKFDNDKRCSTPHLTDEDIQNAFLSAANKLLATKTAVIANGREMQALLFDTTELEAEQAQLLEEAQVVSDMVQQAIQENARTALNQTEYQKRYDSLVQRFDRAKTRLEEVTAEIQEKQTASANMGTFLNAFEQMPDALADFSLESWHSMVDFATVYSIDDIRFTFKNGQEIKS